LKSCRKIDPVRHDGIRGPWRTAAVQTVDLAAILRRAPATDPDMIAIRESLDGPGNYAVIAPADYAAPALPAAWIELRMDQGGNITFLTFQGVDHMASARKFFHIKAARDWLFRQVKA
jgi:hypothetical protein